MDDALQKIIQKGIAQGMSDEDIKAVAKAYQAKNATAPDFATSGMIPASKPSDPPTGRSLTQEGLEYGLAGALPEKTPGPLAAGSAALLALPAAVAAGAGMPELGGAALGLRDAAVAGGATYAVSKLPPAMQMPAELALAALGMKTARGQKIGKMFGFGKGGGETPSPSPSPALPPTFEEQMGLGGEGAKSARASMLQPGGNGPIPSPRSTPSSVVPKPPMSAKADAFAMPPSSTAKAFEEMMNQLYPEEDGPLPGNGTYKEPGVKPKAPANFPDSKSKAARGETGRMSTNDRAVYKREIGKGVSDEEAMNTVLVERKTRGDSIYADKKAAAAARKKPLTGAPK